MGRHGGQMGVAAIFAMSQAADEVALELVEVPSDDVLAWILRQVDAATWLEEHGAELPERLDRDA